MTIAKIRKGNRITIPVDEMRKKALAEGDEVYFELLGKMGRDVTAQLITSYGVYNPATGAVPQVNMYGPGTISSSVSWQTY